MGITNHSTIADFMNEVSEQVLLSLLCFQAANIYVKNCSVNRNTL